MTRDETQEQIEDQRCAVFGSEWGIEAGVELVCRGEPDGFGARGLGSGTLHSIALSTEMLGSGSSQP